LTAQEEVHGQERVVEDPVLGQRYIFRRVAAEDGGEELELEMWVEPGGGVLIPHIHPKMEERFHVLEGEVTFLLGRRRIPAGPGESAVAPPGVRHGYQNTGQATAHVMCHVRHPQDEQLQQFLEDAAALDRAGAFTKRGVPRSFKAALQGAVMLRHYREMVRFTMPPAAIQDLVLAPLARMGERRGYKAGAFA
jgi:quercetin dioxygenase-like cupin family protein